MQCEKHLSARLLSEMVQPDSMYGLLSACEEAWFWKCKPGFALYEPELVVYVLNTRAHTHTYAHFSGYLQQLRITKFYAKKSQQKSEVNVKRKKCFYKEGGGENDECVQCGLLCNPILGTRPH